MIAANMNEHDTQPQAAFQTAVLLLVFNRPRTTREVFAVLRRIKPARLYVAADGARPDRAGEEDLCAEARAIATDVDWDCEVRTLFRDENLGCGRGVAEAIDWFFAHEEQGIILEDDCLLAESWFPFVEELLDRYRDDERITCLSAMHLHLDDHRPAHIYYFGIHALTWGWATWRRAWAHYDHSMARWPEVRDTPWLRRLGQGNRLFENYWRERFQGVYEDRIDTWDFRWLFACWMHGGLGINPARNLVKNIGFGQDATHTTADWPLMSRMVLQSMPRPLSHPPAVEPDVAADRWTMRNVYMITRRRHYRRVIRNLPVLRTVLALKRRLLAGS